MQTLKKLTIILIFILLNITLFSALNAYSHYDATIHPAGTGQEETQGNLTESKSPPLPFYIKLKDNLQNLMKSKLNTIIIISGLLLAFFVGALHALAPGHGKTIIAAYLVGSKGTVWHAVFLGIIVTVTHTFSVIILGLIVLFSSSYIVPEKIYPWLSFFSAMLVTGMGIWLFLRSYKNSLLAPYAGKEVLQHSHHHLHKHDEINQKSDKKIRLWDLFTLGIAGGIIPCPDAIVILLIGVAMNRILYGIIIILAFGLGLAVVLITIGILVISTRSFIQKFTGRDNLILYRLPMVSAIIIIIIGLMLGIQTLIGSGVLL